MMNKMIELNVSLESKLLILDPKQPKKYGAEYVGGAHL